MAITNHSETDAIRSWNQKSELEKTISTGVHGIPEIKRDEKIHYLGEFRERVIKRLTNSQVMETAIYPEIIQALQHNSADILIINGDLPYSAAKKYEQLAIKMGKKHMIVHDPGFIGTTGLIVVSEQAVDLEDIDVEDRHARLAKLGLPSHIIKSAGKKLCKKCLDQILQADPAEAINYKLLTLADRFWGEACPACDHPVH